MKARLAALLLAAAALTAAGLPVISTPCPTEDSVQCYWDSSTRGNRAGHSFIALTEQLQIQTSWEEQP